MIWRSSEGRGRMVIPIWGLGEVVVVVVVVVAGMGLDERGGRARPDGGRGCDDEVVGCGAAEHGLSCWGSGVALHFVGADKETVMLSGGRLEGDALYRGQDVFWDSLLRNQLNGA